MRVGRVSYSTPDSRLDSRPDSRPDSRSDSRPDSRSDQPFLPAIPVSDDAEANLAPARIEDTSCRAAARY